MWQLDLPPPPSPSLPNLGSRSSTPSPPDPRRPQDQGLLRSIGTAALLLAHVVSSTPWRWSFFSLGMPLFPSSSTSPASTLNKVTHDSKLESIFGNTSSSPMQIVSAKVVRVGIRSQIDFPYTESSHSIVSWNRGFYYIYCIHDTSFYCLY